MMLRCRLLRRALDRHRSFTLAAVLLLPALSTPLTLAQAGGGAGGGAGTGSGAGGAGAGSAGPGSAGAPGGAGAGQAGSATTGTTGAAAQGTPGNAAQGAATAANGQQQGSAAATAAGAAPGSDPRKPPAAKPGALTLQQVVDRARANNPTLLAAAANVRAIRAQEIQAGVRANPYLGLAGNNVTLPANGSQANPYGYSIQVSRLFERGNKREYRLQNARATTSQTAFTLDDTSRQTILAVRSAFTKMIIAKESLELSRAQLTDFRHEVDINHERYTAGDIGKLDFERLDLQLASFESDEANAEIAVAQASDQLQTLLGVDTPSTNFDITGDIIPPVIDQTRDALIQTALLRRPDLQAATAAVLAAEATSRLAIANGTADPTLEGEYDRSGTYNSAGFNINIPLRLFDRNQGNKETARLGVENAQFTTTAARNQVASDVDQAWVGYTRAKVLSDRFTSHYLDESTDVLSIARFAYDHGGLALIDYLDALRDARSATSDALNAYLNTWLAIHQLSAATATDLTP